MVAIVPVRCLSHPKGRYINRRPENALDLERTFEVALEEGVVVEGALGAAQEDPCGHAGKAPDPIERRPHTRGTLHRVVRRKARIDGGEQEAVVAVAWIRDRRAERATREQPAGRHQHQRDRNLADDEPRAGPESPLRCARRPQVLEVVDEIQPRELQCRRQTRHERAEHGEGRCGGRHIQVRPGIELQRDRHHRSQRCEQHPGGPPSEEQPDRAPGKREDETLRDQLPDDPAAAGEPSWARRAQELHVQVGGGREEARTQRSDQRRAQGVVEHRRQEPALDHPGGVQELRGRD
jgi:hypothetical protein